MKNKTKKRVGIVAAMLGLVVAIGATAGTTLAKYISSATVTSQTATVAQWGYTMTADVTKMFGETYGEVQATNSLAKVSGTDMVVVSAKTGKNVVAPGTTGEMKFTVNGTAEVNAVLTIDLSKLNLNNIYLSNNAGKTGYYPINWYVGEGTNKVKVNTDNTSEVTEQNFVDKIKAVVNTMLEGTNFKVKTEDKKVLVFLPANTSVSDLNLSISWDWAFETNKATTGNYNDEDTLLGLISYGAIYEELPENVANWIKNNYAGNEVTAVDDAKAAVVAAETALATAKQNVANAKVALETAKAAVASAQATLARVEAEYGKSSEQWTAAKAKLDEANTNLATANTNLTTAESTLEAKEGDLATKEGDLATKEAALASAAKSAYADLVRYSNIEISFGFSSTIEQTQLTADKFQA